jgi:hypothetical protein
MSKIVSEADFKILHHILLTVYDKNTMPEMEKFLN